ncbi:hypothetical protein BCR32DRAFT_280323 [Anaeromyces robustus]|uniref:Uncharacterized protein n=1 Tax=Anaeromyces robustus TaxID=1754192 RepID=A0A1Y1X5P4_9FUNG|nr:hypothetical protein BCR32DRAFT_280323 [Anaeromyces robustus]|eukprot:ORX80686.1 hypothetical protein BCR32DRAFT_280323 [Anaeromyces robustus]
MGIKSKIKGSYAYTQWKLGKYTKRRVKNSCSQDWVMERQQYERDRANNYSDNFYRNREIDTSYKMPVVKNNVVNHNTPTQNIVSEARARPVSTSGISNIRREINNTNTSRYSVDPEAYNRITLQKSDFADVLVPSRNYTLVQKSNSSSVAYYSSDNNNNNENRYMPRNYSYTTNALSQRSLDGRRNI